MSLQLVTPAALEPLSLAEAKLHLRIDAPDEDTLIAGLIAAARSHAECLTSRQLLPATWRLVLDHFDVPIHLNRSPAIGIVGIQYLDMSSTWQTVPASDYVLDTQAEPARVAPVFGKIWPVTLPQIGAVRIDFTAGYPDAAQVPQGIKQWMLLRVGTLYANREQFAVLSRGSQASLPESFVDRLLDPWRVVTY